MARLILVSLLAFFSVTAQAGQGNGIGVILGSPNGVTFRHWLSEQQSIDASAGWSISNSRFQVNSNFLFTQPDVLQLGEETFDLFFGGGLSLRTKSGKQNGEVVFGPRIPVGASYEFTDPNIELFTQFAVNIGLIPSSDIYLDANVGVRFYF